VACAVLFGLSAGAVDAALNAYAARHFGVRQVNLMHAAYGIGAATSPLIVTAVIGMGRSWRWAYITVMAIQALLAALFAGTLRRWRDASAEPVAVVAASTEDQSSGRPRWWRRAPAVGGLLVVAVQIGLKSAIGLWAFVYLLSAVALPAATAGVIVSSYWAAIVLGRILLGALAQRIGIWKSGDTDHRRGDGVRVAADASTSACCRGHPPARVGTRAGLSTPRPHYCRADDRRRN